MNFTSRTGIKALAVVIGVGAAGIVADWHLAASPSPSLVSPRKPDNLPRVDVVRPRRAAVAERLQTNATLEAFEEADLFAKVTGYLSDVRVDIDDHVKAGQILVVIDIPELEQQLAEDQAQLASKRSALETARRQVDHDRAHQTLQDITLSAKKRSSRINGSPPRWSIRRAPMRRSPRPMSALRKRAAPWPLTKSTSPQRPWRKLRRCSPIRRLWRRSMAWWRGAW